MPRATKHERPFIVTPGAQNKDVASDKTTRGCAMRGRSDLLSMGLAGEALHTNYPAPVGGVRGDFPAENSVQSRVTKGHSAGIPTSRATPFAIRPTVAGGCSDRWD